LLQSYSHYRHHAQELSVFRYSQHLKIREIKYVYLTEIYILSHVNVFIQQTHFYLIWYRL
jgi:hypothetical protein